jgi:hypothetical protein
MKSMKKHLLISIILATVSLLNVHRYEPSSSCANGTYLSIKKIDTYKSETQHYFGYSSFQIAASFMTSYLIKSIKLVWNFQKKITQGVWIKINKLALERYSDFDGKQSFFLLTSLRF